MWAQFLTNEAKDEALAAFFKRHQRDYDGTELRVSHILWPVKPTDDPTRLAAAMEEADDVRTQIVGGKLTFSDAAKKYSAGPSKRNGGDLGFIPARDVMSEVFSKAAFELDKGGVSKPVVDQFGVHLITCTDVKPGERTWREARRELIDAFAREKFLEVADAQRKQVAVKIVDGAQ
jgi:parvulin-like peptidyl-prolyl isomerase